MLSEELRAIARYEACASADAAMPPLDARPAGATTKWVISATRSAPAPTNRGSEKRSATSAGASARSQARMRSAPVGSPAGPA